MPVNKRKKVTRYRGSKTHGGGSMKKRRGAGHRGGRGNASTGKRSDARRPSIWKDPKYFGKHGFKTPGQHHAEVLNLSDLQDRALSLVDHNLAEKKGDALTIDLSKLGVEKLLATGKVTSPLHITVKSASKRAIEKVEQAGGSVTVA